jgi:hypothetical protein
LNDPQGCKASLKLAIEMHINIIDKLNGPRLNLPCAHSDFQKGQATLLVVVAMSVFVIGALGLAIDGSQMYAQRQMAQAAADAAAQAGIMSIFKGTNGTSAFPFGTGSPPIASYICTTTDGRTPCVYARYNGFGATSSDSVTLSFPSAVSGVTLSPVTVPALKVSVQRTLRTGLIRFIPGVPPTSRVTASATAGLVGSVSASCVYVLDPSAANAFQATNGTQVAISGCSIISDSTSNSAILINGGSTVTASAIAAVGGAVVSNGGVANPAPITGIANVPDPFKTVPAPPVGSCDFTNFSRGSGTWTLFPGVYCGGISLHNGAVTTFSPGQYIVNGGGLSIAGGTTTGSNVMLYLTGTNTTYGSVIISNGASVTLSAQSSGPYLGLLFYQDRSVTSSVNAQFIGGSTMQLTGSLYFPTTNLSYSNGSSAVTYSTGLVAKQIAFSGGSTNILYDPTGLKTGLFSTAVALIQ